MSHFPFRHLWPIYFPWASSALSNPVFPWAFTNSFGLPWPNFILHPWGSWIFHQPLTFFTFITSGLLWPILTFLHHILSMGLLLLSFRAPLGPFASSRPICLFYGPIIHYSCHLGLMAFLSNYQLISAHVARLLPSTALPKTSHQQSSNTLVPKVLEPIKLPIWQYVTKHITLNRKLKVKIAQSIIKAQNTIQPNHYLSVVKVDSSLNWINLYILETLNRNINTCVE